MTGTQLHIWKKLFSFWFYTICFALSWFICLFLLSHQTIKDFQVSLISHQLQAAYVTGLYLWMLWLCSRLDSAQTGQAISTNIKGFFKGGLIAIISLGLLWSLFVLLGWSKPQMGSGSVWIWVQNLLMALSIAWIEERVFRGFMLSTLKKGYSWRTAICIQACCYALVHLLRTDLNLIAWTQAFLGLGLTGVLLGHLRQRNQSLAMGFGLHASWVWFCSSIAQFNYLSWQPEYTFWTGQGNPIYGLSGSILLALLLLFFPLSYSLTQQDKLCNNESLSQ